jgi:fatty acid desaturase
MAGEGLIGLPAQVNLFGMRPPSAKSAMVMWIMGGSWMPPFFFPPLSWAPATAADASNAAAATSIFV